MAIRWVKTDFNKEAGEFQRIVEDFSGDDVKAKKDNLRGIQSLYSKSSLVPMNDTMWKNLDNTDSWSTTTLEKIQSAIRRNSKNGSGIRSIENILKEFISGSVRAPIVMQYNNGQDNTLIAGNTRLMVARMLGIKPQVILIKSDW